MTSIEEPGNRVRVRGVVKDVHEKGVRNENGEKILITIADVHI